MTSLTRRLFLRNTAAAGAVATVVAAPGAVAATASENPELLRLGAELVAASEAFRAAAERKRVALESYVALCPAVPEILVAPHNAEMWFTEGETDPEGNSVYPASNKAQRRIYSSHAIEQSCPNLKVRSDLGRHYRQIHAEAQTFETSQEEARTASGLDAAISARYFAGRELGRIMEAVAKQEALTPAGLVIKARALLAHSAVGPWEQSRAQFALGPDLAQLIVTFFGSDVK